MGNKEFEKKLNIAKEKRRAIKSLKGNKKMNVELDDLEDDDDEEMSQNAVQKTWQGDASLSMNPAGDQNVDDDKIRITMLGATSSGKTLFLSGVYQSLIVSHATDIYLRIDDAKTNGRQHESIESIALVRDDEIAKKLPLGTKETKTYDLILMGGGKRYCEFEFWDYRGGLIKEIPVGRKEGQDIDEFREHLKKSDVILVFADSIAVSQFEEVEKRELKTHANLMNLIFTDILGDKTYHIVLVLTKSDDSYVKPEDKENYFEGLCAKAMEVFEPLKAHSRSFAVIPVSAVGENALETTQMGEELNRTWEGKLKENIVPKPQNIDLVILYACRDILNERLEKWRQQADELNTRRQELEQEIDDLRGIDRLLKKSELVQKMRELALERDEIRKMIQELQADIKDMSDAFEDAFDKYVHYEMRG